MSSNSPKNRIFFNSLSPINNHNHRIIIPKQEYISKAVAISKPITVTTRPPPNVQPIGSVGRPPLSPRTSPMDLAHISLEVPEPTKKSFSCLECGLVYSKRQATTDMLQIHDKLCDQWRSIWMQNGNIKVRIFFRLTIFQDLTPQCQLVFQTQILCRSWKKAHKYKRI